MNLTVKEIQAIIKKKNPVGLIVPEHDSTGHYYRHTGLNEKYASVTTKSGFFESTHIKKWAASEAVRYIDKNWDIITLENKEDIFKAAVLAHQDQFEDAGNIGTQGHEIIDEYLKIWIKDKIRPKDITKLITLEDYRLWAIARSAEMFCKDFKVKPVVSEMFVASPKHKYGGTLDSLMMVERPIYDGKKIIEELALVDWKTSNSIDKMEYAMQVSAYWRGLYEITELRPKHIFIVRLDKKVARYQVMQIVHRPSALRAFLNVSKVYDWLTDDQEKLAPLVAKERISLK